MENGPTLGGNLECQALRAVDDVTGVWMSVAFGRLMTFRMLSAVFEPCTAESLRLNRDCEQIIFRLSQTGCCSNSGNSEIRSRVPVYTGISIVLAQL